MNQDRIFFKLIFVFLFISHVSSTNACTAFCLAKKGKSVIVGKNLDWPIGDGIIIINPKGISRIGQGDSSSKPIIWTSKYGSITFNMFGEGFPLGGINEKGLVVEELSYSPSVYPTNDSSYCLNELQWIQYQLDNYTSVEEVIINLENIQISKLLFGLHYFLSDSSGNSAVVEFIDGKILAYNKEQLPYPILANNSYSSSLKYIYKHEGFGGSLPLREGPESPSRFVRAAKLSQDCATANVDYAFKILDNVKQQDTQWSIVYDISNLEISFLTKNNPTKKSINLKKINFTSIPKLFYSLLQEDKNELIDINDFLLLTQKLSENILKQVFEKMIEFGEIDSAAAIKIQEKIISID